MKGTDFHLDQCPHCLGIWFDAGEWTRMANEFALANIDRLWDPGWQRQEREQSAQERAEADLREAFGAGRFTRLMEVITSFSDLPPKERSMAVAFFQEQMRTPVVSAPLKGGPAPPAQRAQPAQPPPTAPRQAPPPIPKPAVRDSGQPPAGPEKQRAAQQQEAGGPGAAETCETLLAPGIGDSEARRLFEEHFQGKTVTWDGVLRDLSSFTFDFVFGDQPGTRAELDLHDLDTSGVGGRMARAVVHLPPEAAEALRGGEGESLRIQGRLLQIDRLMNQIFVASASML